MWGVHLARATGEGLPKESIQGHEDGGVIPEIRDQEAASTEEKRRVPVDDGRAPALRGDHVASRWDDRASTAERCFRPVFEGPDGLPVQENRSPLRVEQLEGEPRLPS